MNSQTVTKRIAVTGGAGFIGSNLLLNLVPSRPDWMFVNIDCLTYAGNLANLKSLEAAPNYRFEKIDITDSTALRDYFDRHQFDAVFHLAAETHVDRSILSPADFVRTNVEGTYNLLELIRDGVERGRDLRLIHVSTDEVFGEAAPNEVFKPDSRYRPSSPYAASKAAADHLVRAYHRTYGLDAVITNCSNNFGQFQFPEKLVPLVIRNAANRLEIPIYGDGLQVRDWLYVEDHCRALETTLIDGKPGQTYLIGARNRLTNLELVHTLCRLVDERLGGEPREALIRFVEDRPGHDRRYALDPSLIENELNWKADHDFDTALAATVDWYLSHPEWVERCISGDYREYYAKNYANRKAVP
jgi:dTDP-glucose 4,6-dehydratase